jgi:hypothetical protein
MTDYETGYRNGESSLLADVNTLCDQLGIDVGDRHEFEAIHAEVERLKSAWRLQQNLLKKQQDERHAVRDKIIYLRQYVVSQDGSRTRVLELLDAIIGDAPPMPERVSDAE